MNSLKVFVILSAILIEFSTAKPQQFSNGNGLRHSSVLQDQLDQFQTQGSNRGSRQFSSGSNDFNANFRFNPSSGRSNLQNSQLGLTQDNHNSRQSFGRDSTFDQNNRQGFNLDGNSRVSNQNSIQRINENSRIGLSNQNTRQGFNINDNTRTGFTSQNQASRRGFNQVQDNQVVRQGINNQNNRFRATSGRVNQLSRNGLNQGVRQRFNPSTSRNRQNRVQDQTSFRNLGSRSSSVNRGQLDQDPSTYSYAYEVNDIESNNLSFNSINSFGHTQQGDGDLTTGFYFVLLPDGRRQEVNYRVDGDSGYVADVQYV